MKTKIKGSGEVNDSECWMEDGKQGKVTQGARKKDCRMFSPVTLTLKVPFLLSRRKWSEKVNVNKRHVHTRRILCVMLATVIFCSRNNIFVDRHNRAFIYCTLLLYRSFKVTQSRNRLTGNKKYACSFLFTATP